MAAQRRYPAEPPAEAEDPGPPFYEATSFIEAPGAAPGAFPVRAYAPGDRVAPEDVAANGWGHLVKVPERFAGVLAPPPVAEPEPGDGTAGEPGDKEE